MLRSYASHKLVTPDQPPRTQLPPLSQPPQQQMVKPSQRAVTAEAVSVVGVIVARHQIAATVQLQEQTQN
jgi:hypothetical protein